jgi:hypothetical protein
MSSFSYWAEITNVSFPPVWDMTGRETETEAIQTVTIKSLFSKEMSLERTMYTAVRLLFHN